MFWIIDVAFQILSADFLSNNELIVDMEKKKD